MTTPIPQCVLRADGIDDIIALNVNWKRLHPFHYHSEDYKTWQESEDTDIFPTVNDLDVNAEDSFNDLYTCSYMRDPTPVCLNIDHRYGNVEYFMRESFFHFHDDGTVQLGGGCGEQIIFQGGTIRIEAPGDIQTFAGRSSINQSDQIILKGHNSVDISSSNRDVRIRAVNNLHLRSDYGILFESTSTSSFQDYSNRIGQDVISAGIVFKSNSDIALIGEDIYLRSGRLRGDTGNVTIDTPVFGVKALSFQCFIERDVTLWYIPDMEANSLSVAGSRAEGVWQFAGGNVYQSGNILAGGRFYDTTTLTTDDTTFLDDLSEADVDAYDTLFLSGWYANGSIGNHNTLIDVGFSYRDADIAGEQYATQNFLLPECRWHRWARKAGAGDPWNETPVMYQGKELYPWPGRQKWAVDETYVSLLELTMYDEALGRSMDRPDPYESPALSEAKLTTPEASYIVISTA